LVHSKVNYTICRNMVLYQNFSKLMLLGTIASTIEKVHSIGALNGTTMKSTAKQANP